MFSETRRSLHKSDEETDLSSLHKHWRFVNEVPDSGPILPVLPSVTHHRPKPKTKFCIEVQLDKDDVKLSKKPVISSKMGRSIQSGLLSKTSSSFHHPVGKTVKPLTVHRGKQFDKSRNTTEKPEMFYDSVPESRHVPNVDKKRYQMHTSIIHNDVIIPKLTSHNSLDMPHHYYSGVKRPSRRHHNNLQSHQYRNGGVQHSSSPVGMDDTAVSTRLNWTYKDLPTRGRRTVAKDILSRNHESLNTNEVIHRPRTLPSKESDVAERLSLSRLPLSSVVTAPAAIDYTKSRRGLPSTRSFQLKDHHLGSHRQLNSTKQQPFRVYRNLY